MQRPVVLDARGACECFDWHCLSLEWSATFDVFQPSTLPLKENSWFVLVGLIVSDVLAGIGVCSHASQGVSQLWCLLQLPCS